MKDLTSIVTQTNLRVCTSECMLSRLHACVCILGGIWGRDYMEIRAAKTASGVLRGPQQGKQEEMGPGARLSCVYILRGSESGRVPILPCLPPPTPSFPPSLLCWPALLRASQGRFLPQLGVLGCVAACLYWSVDFLVAACTYLNIPPAAALCSRPRTASPLLLLHPPHPHPAHSVLSHTLFLLSHSFTVGLLVILFAVCLSLFLADPFFPCTRCRPSSPRLHLSCHAPLLLFLMIQFLLHFHPWFRLAVEERKSRIQWLKKESFKTHFLSFIIFFYVFIFTLSSVFILNSVFMWLLCHAACRTIKYELTELNRHPQRVIQLLPVNIWCILIQVHDTDAEADIMFDMFTILVQGKFW